MTNRNEMLTSERITNAVDIAALGFKETQAIRVAGLRLQAKLVKAFMEIKPQQQACLGAGGNDFCPGNSTRHEGDLMMVTKSLK